MTVWVKEDWKKAKDEFGSSAEETPPVSSFCILKQYFLISLISENCCETVFLYVVISTYMYTKKQSLRKRIYRLGLFPWSSFVHAQQICKTSVGKRHGAFCSNIISTKLDGGRWKQNDLVMKRSMCRNNSGIWVFTVF